MDFLSIPHIDLGLSCTAFRIALALRKIFEKYKLKVLISTNMDVRQIVGFSKFF